MQKHEHLPGARGRRPRLTLLALAIAALPAIGSGCAHLSSNDDPGPGPRIDAPTLYAEGVAFVRKGDLLRAEQYLALAIRAGYPEERVLPWLLDLCLSASRYRAALAYAEPYLDRHPEDRRLRRLVGSIRAALMGESSEPLQHDITKPESHS